MKFSYSAINLFKKCPKKYLEIYIHGKKESSYPLDLGSAIHKVCEEYIKNRLDESRLYTRIWELIQDSDFDKYSMLEEAWNIINYKTLKLFDKAFGNRNIQSERFISIPFLENNILNGKIDVVVTEKNKLSIIDFKTSNKYRGNYNPDWSQLYLYAYLILNSKEILDKSITDNIKGVLWYLRTNTILTIDISIDDIQKTMIDIKRTASEIINEKYKYDNNQISFQPKENCFCRTCSYKSECELIKSKVS